MKRLLATLLCSCLPFVVSAQSADSAAFDRLLDGFARMYARALQEKVYVTTDKPYYSAGERIFLRGWVVDAVSHTGHTPSNFLYVELLDDCDGLVRRIKLKREGDGFANTLDLGADIAEGTYALVAYTQWQCNFDPAFFFRRRIEIGNTIDDQVLCEVSYQANADSTATAFVRLHDGVKPYAGRKVRCVLLREGRRGRNHTVRTDSRGIFTIDYRPSSEEPQRIEIEFDAPMRQFSRKLSLPDPRERIDLQFLPEGGCLVGDEEQRVAFRAVGSDGYSVDLSGAILNERGDTLAPFSTLHRGMGTVRFAARAGERYHAAVRLGERLLRFELPPVEPRAVALRADRRQGGWACRLLGDASGYPSNLAAVVHSRGALVQLVERVADGFFVAEDRLLDGVSQVAVFDPRSGMICSERLIFKHPTDTLSARIARGEGLDEPLRIEVRDAAGNPVQGDFAVSVTDSRLVREAGDEPDACSYLLLGSELSGHVEGIGDYFAAARDKVDLLMLTHGWTRFDTQRVLCDSLPPLQFGFETTQSICGRVTNIWNRDPRQAQIVLYNEHAKRFEHFDLKERRNGNFRIEGLDFPDSTRFTVMALNKAGKDKIYGVRLFTDPLPVNRAGVRSRLVKGSFETTIPEEYLDQSKRQYYESGGERVIDLEPIYVTARPLRSSVFIGVTPQHEVAGDKLQYCYNVIEMAGALPGVYTNGQTIKVRVMVPMTMTDYLAGGHLGPARMVTPVIYAGDMRIDSMEDLLSLDKEDVVSVGYIPPSRAGQYGPDALQTGIVFYTLKPINQRKSLMNPSSASIIPLGYKQPVERYLPEYEPQAGASSRTTVAWEPFVRTDAQGCARIGLPAHDHSYDYRVRIEGIDTQGRALSAVTRIASPEQ